MRKTLRIALFALAAFALTFAVAGAASAQYREFTGQINKINGKKMIVDNRMGDKVTFDKIDTTAVEDKHKGDKKSWDDLKKDDWVTVEWKMMDKPRKAYKVIVVPPKDEKAEDM
jgi:hypothetical protein